MCNRKTDIPKEQLITNAREAFLQMRELENQYFKILEKEYFEKERKNLKLHPKEIESRPEGCDLRLCTDIQFYPGKRPVIDFMEYEYHSRYKLCKTKNLIQGVVLCKKSYPKLKVLEKKIRALFNNSFKVQKHFYLNTRPDEVFVSSIVTENNSTGFKTFLRFSFQSNQLSVAEESHLNLFSK